MKTNDQAQNTIQMTTARLVECAKGAQRIINGQIWPNRYKDKRHEITLLICNFSCSQN